MNRNIICYQRFNKAELIRICACGSSYLYSHYLRHGMCAQCQAASKRDDK